MYKSNIIKALSRFGTTNGTKNPDEKDNLGNFIGLLYMWDTVADYARKQASDLQKQMENENLIPSKAALREDANGSNMEKILAQSPSFQIQAKITTPRSSFDKDKFIERASEILSIDKHKLVEIANECVKESAAPVSIKVVEK